MVCWADEEMKRRSRELQRTALTTPCSKALGGRTGLDVVIGRMDVLSCASSRETTCIINGRAFRKCEQEEGMLGAFAGTLSLYIYS